MFRKEPEVKSFSNLKGSERKRLLKTTLDQYDLPELPREFVNENLFPKVIEHASYETAPYGGRTVKGTIYLDEQTKLPIWFDTRDSNGFIPTVYTLWKAPYLLPVVYTHMGVLERLSNGSNLMIRGCMVPFSSQLKKGNLVAVSVIERPHVMVAVGYCMMNLYEINQITDDVSGVAVDIAHVYMDRLYQLDHKLEPIPLPEEPEDIPELPVQESNVETNVEPDEIESNEIEPNVEPTLESNVDSNVESTVEPTQIDQVTTKTEELTVESVSPLAPEAEPEEAPYQLTTDDVDQFFIRSLLYTITQETLDLPMSSSTLMTHILKNLPPVNPNQVNMKKTSWRKSAKFFKAMDKLGLAKVKGKGDSLTVISVAGKDNPKVAGFEPYRVKKIGAVHTEKEEVRMTVEQMYKPRSPTRPIFNALDKEYDRYYTERELKVLISAYMSRLVDKDPKMVKVDETLQGMGVSGGSVARSKVLGIVLNPKNFQLYYRIYKGEPSGKLRKGNPPSVRILVEQIRGRKKTMTRVSGLETYYIEPEQFAGMVRVKCSGSTTVTESAEGYVVSVQGSHERTVEELLVKEYGLRSSWIAVTKGKGVKGEK